MEAEWIRLNKIHGNKFDVANAVEVLDYVKRRDSQVRTQNQTT